MDICSLHCAVLDELAVNLGKFVHLDVQETYVSDGDDNSDEVEEGFEGIDQCGSEPVEKCSNKYPTFSPEPVKKCLEKCATFPSPDMKLSCGPASTEEDDEVETALRNLFSEEPLQRSLSLPKLELVSALKGSREKRGVSLQKLSVKWAPDVYDPIPNSLSHTVKSKQKKSRKEKDNYKKNWKKGHKGYSSRGGGGKDKKQIRKVGGRPDRCYRTIDASDRFVEPAGELGEFDAGSPDYCGSSFLKNSVTNFHYSVAEAS